MQKILEVKDITKKYGKKEVLKGVSFKIFAGEITGLIGVNGSGKSTLLEILCGVKRKDRGEIIGITSNCKNFGYMPQTFSLFNDLTVKENLDYFAVLYNLKKERVTEILNLCHLSEKKDYVCSQLSGGFRQLVSLAVSILHNPKLLILDEPTSAMDPLFRDSFWKIIKNYLGAGGAILVTTHYMEEINICKRIVILSNGKIVYNDSVKETFNSGKYNSASDLIYAFTSEDRYDK